MAINLVESGHDFRVFELVEESMQQVVDKGRAMSSSAVEAANDVDFVISMLPAGKHVEAVYVGSEGKPSLFSVISSKTVVIDSSTIDSQTARKVSKIAEDQGLQMLDAPVSGGVAAAGAGTLAFMCGGTEDSSDQAKPILQCMGKNIFYSGGSGAGQVAKACNNMLLAISMIGTSEAIKLGIDNVLDPAALSEIMLASSGRNWTLECYNPCPEVMENDPASNGYKPGFMVDLMCKHLELAAGVARSSDSRIALGSMARDIFKMHASNGNGLRDFSSIFES